MLVTGASSGIGAALARALAHAGDTVALVARRADRLDEVLADCRATSPASAALGRRPLGPRGRGATWPAQIWDHYDGLDVVVNNAAVPMRRHVTRLTMAEVERTMRINYFSPVAISLALLPRMLERGSGTIVNVSSLGGRLGITAEAAYSGSKFALAGWSESMAVDLDGTGVSVKLILPGAIDTEIWDQPDNDAPLYDGPKEPPEEIAGGMVDAIDSDRFEHYLPDMKAVIEAKTADIDSFIVGMRALSDSGTARERTSEGTAVRRAAGPRRGPAHARGRARDDARRHPLRPPRHRRCPPRPARLGGDQADPLGHLRLRRQARAGRLQHGRHRQSDGRLLLPSPRSGPRGGGRGRRARAGGPRPRCRPARRAQPVADLRRHAASTRRARPARPET